MLSALLAICEGNPLITGGFPHKGSVMQNFDILFVISLNKLDKLLNMQFSSQWSKMPWDS